MSVSFTSMVNMLIKIQSNVRSAVDSILDAVLTVSPNKQYLGIVKPTTPATTGPVCNPDKKKHVLYVTKQTLSEQCLSHKNFTIRPAR